MSCNKKLFNQDVHFVIGARGKEQFPRSNLPQIAFVGKSNVGKSSLINAICNRKSLVKVSNSPGKTKEINFFNLADKLMLVDLPGYGFAKVPLDLREIWSDLIMHYLRYNPKLCLVNLLIDAKCGVKENDLSVISIINSFAINLQVVYTKVDKVGGDLLMLDRDNSYLKAQSVSDIVLTSVKHGIGIKRLRSIFNDFITFDKESSTFFN